MDFSKTYQPQKVEEKIYRFWEKRGLFKPQKKKKKFVVSIAPPNITGELHMGHALENTLVDVIVRRERMLQKKVLWIPGIDHAGIATQNVVEKELKKEGKTRFDLGKKEFLKRIWAWKEKYEKIILEQLKKLGCSCDWSKTRFTMDKDYSKSVKEAFFHYYQKGWIYRGKRVVNWCQKCQTSLADLELEYKEEKGKLWFVKYPLKDFDLKTKYLCVATTRPETILGDTALAVNPKDQRYQKFVGKKAVLPILEREIPILKDKRVNPHFGTGVVKVTPGHDFIDWEIAKDHKLKIIQIIGKDGKMNKNSKICQGLSPLECREKVIEILKEKNLLEKVKDYQISLPYCYRCHTLIEPLPSFQWFLKMKKLSQMAKEAVKKGKVKFWPRHFEKIYFNWIENVKDWCISRQIWWGHRVPVWRCQKGYFVFPKEPKKCPLCKKCKPKQSKDVLDTWFSSALWPFAILGWPKKTKDLEEFYPQEFISCAKDIINLWIARMIFSGIELTKKPPFKIVYVHGTILTKEGQRMSKSLGTGVDPSKLIEKYGADSVRFGLIWQTTQSQDVKFDERAILAGKKFCNKIWNAARFVIKNLQGSKIKNLKIKNLGKEEREMIKKLKETIREVNGNLDQFKFSKALQKIYHSFWHEFCDKYIEISKLKMQNSKREKEKTLKVLLFVLLTFLKLLHPFLPFITEEIYQKLPLKEKKPSLMLENWPK